MRAYFSVSEVSAQVEPGAGKRSEKARLIALALPSSAGIDRTSRSRWLRSIKPSWGEL
jgi:hypothetical protein